MNNLLNVYMFDSSRPDLMKFCWDAFDKYCFIEQKYKIFYHDDIIYPSLSQKTFNFFKTKKEVIFEQHKPNVGLGPSMMYMFKKYSKSKYIFQMQMDYEFERPVEIDKCVWLMENNPQINAIIFNKRKNIRWIEGFEYKNYEIDGENLVLSPGFHFQPGIWRRDFFMERFKGWKHYPEAQLSKAWKKLKKISNRHEYLEKNMGAYIYGKVFESRYCRHIGNTWRCANWRRKSDNKPGGKINDESAERAKWLPVFEKRPRATDFKGGYFK